MIPSLILWALDRSIRLIRSVALHGGAFQSFSSFKAASATVQLFSDPINGDVVRLDFWHPHQPWSIGQHFYLCFTDGNIWQSHPMTPLSLPESHGGSVLHSYVFRAKKGETRNVAEKLKEASKAREIKSTLSTGIILTGPYGEDLTKELKDQTNVLCVAGGSGITFVLPVLLHLLLNELECSRKIELVWVIRRRQDIKWISKELEVLKKFSQIKIRIFVTREPGLASSTSSSPTIEKDQSDLSSKESSSSSHSSSHSVSQVPNLLSIQHLNSSEHHPDLNSLTRTFIDDTDRGPTTIFASGPGGMIAHLRKLVASCNDGKQVWKGDQKFDVRLFTDNRLEG